MQKIEITLKEYKQLRDIIEKWQEDYYTLLNKYNILATNYNNLMKETKKPKMKKIGF